MRLLRTTAACALMLATSGCLAAAYAPLAGMIGGSALRAGAKKVDVVLGNGVTPQLLQSKKVIGISVNGANAQTGQYVVAFGEGGTNASVFSDMLSKEFLKMNMGYDPRVISEPISESTPASKLTELANSGIDMILIGNMNLSMTTNTASGFTGGDWSRTGVTAFTVKGLDPATRRTLLIMTVEYKTAKAAQQVATDVTQLFRDAVLGTGKSNAPAAAASASQGNSGRSTAAEPAPPPAPAAPVEPTKAAPSAAMSGLAVSTAAAAVATPRAPRLSSPGGSADPGPSISTLTPTMTWNAVDGATAYGVYVRDLTTNVVVFSGVTTGNTTSLVLPPGKLTAGHKYRWNVRAKNGAGFGPYSGYSFFQT